MNGALAEDAPIFEVMRTMRAMRRLRSDPVPRATLVKLIEAASWAPSGGNAQGFSFLIVDDREQIAALAPRLATDRILVHGEPVSRRAHEPRRLAAFDRSGALPGRPLRGSPGADRRLLLGAPDRQADACQRATDAASDRALGASQRGAFRPQLPRFVGRGEAACAYPAVQNLLLAARALGLGAVLTMWHLFFEQEFKRQLEIPPHVHTFAIIPIGYPKGRLGPVACKPAEELVCWNRFGQVGARDVRWFDPSWPC